jgi:hypothetical protein
VRCGLGEDMPNPPRPTEVKRKLGNPGKRAMPALSTVAALPAAQGTPTPLRPLLTEGQRLWERVWADGGVWLSPATDIELVQLLAETMDEREGLRAFVMTGQAEWRDRVALRSVDDQIKSMLSALGFTPADRTRMGVAEVRAVSKLEQLQARARR